MIKLFQLEAVGWICVELGIAPKCLSYAFVFVVQDWWKRVKQMSCENRPFSFRKISSEFLDFSDRRHGTIIVLYHAEANKR